MKKLFVFALVGMLAGSIAVAEAKKKKENQYNFSCMNYWNQERPVTVGAPNLDEARMKLRNDYTLYSEYSNKCSYRGEQILDKKAKKLAQEKKPVNPGE